MEQVRLLAAIGLSFLVLFVWSVFFSYQPVSETEDIINENKINNEYSESKSIPKTRYKNNINSTSYRDVKEKNELFLDLASPNRDNREITIDTPLFTMKISENGAVIKSLVLKNYRENNNINSDFKELIPKELDYGNFLTYLSKNNPLDVEQSFFKTNLKSDFLIVKDENVTLDFLFEDKKGLSLIKSFIFNPDSYLVNVNIKVKNNSKQIIRDSLVLSLKGIRLEKEGYSFEGPSFFIDNHLKQIKNKKINSVEIYNGKIDWISIADRYFMSSLILPAEFKGHIKLDKRKNYVENKIVSDIFTLIPENQMEFNLSIFMGPKSIKVLSDIGHNMDKAIHFGIFNFIAKPCLWFMNKIYSIIPNYGIAIIIITISTKLLLWPIGSKGYRSMSEMKKIQPLIVEIRNKYKNDKQKMNREIMALYKTYRVNPMGGCLPMFLQIPVFFALYRMLYQAIELRHAPFLMWINDLSAPDRLFNFAFSIPFMQPPYGIPVLTIVMGGTMFLQQKMAPSPGDPMQAKMMLFMPVIFTFIFINFSSGLVLYWLINNIISIVQQYYIQQKTR